MNADTYLRRYANRPEYLSRDGWPAASSKATSSNSTSVLKAASDAVNQVSDWVDFDSLASVLIPDEKALISALNVLDGVTSAQQIATEAKQHSAESAPGLGLKTGLRVGLSLAGALPGVTGAVCEGLLGAWTFNDGVAEAQESQATMGLTQFAASVGVGLVAASVGGPAGAALILAANAGRAGYRFYHHNQS
jgi:hypothetical protein